MDSKNKIITALNSKSHFFIMEGDVEYVLNEIELYYSTKEVSLSYIDSENLGADNTRMFVSELLKKSSTEDTIYIIKDFQNVEFISQNILLKSLETLHAGKRIIVICEHTSGILDTILSRAYHLYILNESGSAKSNIREFIDGNRDSLDKLKFLFDLFSENSELVSNIRTMSMDDFIQNKKNYRILNYILEYFKRIEGNCNKDLCADLLIYKMMEDK